MGLLDWLLLVIVGASVGMGASRGFIGAVASMAGWVLGVWVAFSFGGEVARLVAGSDEPGGGLLLAAYGLCFVGVCILVGLVGWAARRLAHGIGLGLLDRALGAALGALRGAFVGCVLVVFAGFTRMPESPDWHLAPVTRWFVPGAGWLTRWLPDWAADRVDLGTSADAAASA
jgi:membrane protein required for colicin V production